MKVLILTYGSRGDVQPYLALAKRLNDAGHSTLLATSERFAGLAGEHGIAFAPLSDAMLAILDTEQGRELLETTTGPVAVVRRMLSMLKQVEPMQRELVQQSGTVALEAMPDVIVYHPKAYGAPAFAELLGVPAILGLPVPMFVPTGERPNIGFPRMRLGKAYNRATYWLTNALMRLAAGRQVRKWRRQNGMPDRRLDLLHGSDGEPAPVMHAHSRHVLSRPADWPDNAIVTGYWFLDPDEEWHPDPALADFLEGGPPPIYVGFGSMAGRNPARLARIVTKALADTGNRAILATGWNGLEADVLPDTVFKIEQAPHDWLFRRVSAVVHHGGAGTTAAALRAGKPSIVVPFFGDQPFWGNRIHALGAGPRPIPLKALSADTLATAIREATGNPKIARAAAEIGEKIRREDGIGEATRFIESVTASHERNCR